MTLKNKVIATKASAQQLARWRAAAEAEGRTLSGWLRRVADQAAAVSPPINITKEVT